MACGAVSSPPLCPAAPLQAPLPPSGSGGRRARLLWVCATGSVVLVLLAGPLPGHLSSSSHRPPRSPGVTRSGIGIPPVTRSQSAATTGLRPAGPRSPARDPPTSHYPASWLFSTTAGRSAFRTALLATLCAAGAAFGYTLQRGTKWLSAAHRPQHIAGTSAPPPAWAIFTAAGTSQSMSPPVPLARTVFVAETLLPTVHGDFRVRSYRHTLDGVTFTDPIAIVHGTPEDRADVAVRVHDACWTSEVLGSLKCDCAQQLQQALAYIRTLKTGVVLYLHQEGRGIGLANKIAAYRMQELGMDTVQANRVLGFADDSREYSAVKDILDDLRVRSVRLMTNNPRKVRELRSLGVRVTSRLSCIVPDPGVLAAQYLATKEEQMGHNLTEEPDVDVLCVLDNQARGAERFGWDGAHGDGGF
eukprot:TRINITY_DN2998_c0_g1_i1.p1 TRINITY_DN2998_c0_g1~~TRINITY_DN2998_c0_g1_i1.p1  ORF type:complete len:425 (-),score=75.43 TRINITY_DN2998_c0_g1_i1:333-1580(-)